MLKEESVDGGGANEDGQSQQQVASTTTWPKAHLSQRTLSDLHYRIELERAIQAARQCTPSKDTVADTVFENNDAATVAECQRLKAKLLKALEKVRDSKNELMLAKAGRKSNKRSVQQQTKPEPPHFGSMIISGSTLQKKEAQFLSHWVQAAKARPSFRKRSVSILSDSTTLRAEKEVEEALEARELKAFTEEEEEPFLLRHFPVFSTLLFAFLLIALGSALFRLVDSDIAGKPFPIVLTFCLQTLGTIGWGDVRVGSPSGQIICTLYTLFGVPIFFSALANLGRALLSDFYTIDWIFLTCVVRARQPGEPVLHYHMPIQKALQWLCVHQFVGLLLYGELFKHYRPIETLYFCLTSMATIGIGDYHPDAANLFEAVAAILFIGSGIGLLAALLIAIAYQFQTLFFCALRQWLQRRFYSPAEGNK